MRTRVPCPELRALEFWTLDELADSMRRRHPGRLLVVHHLAFFAPMPADVHARRPGTRSERV